MADRWAVSKNVLVLIAGLVWSFAGTMVCVVGLPLLWSLGPGEPILYPLALVIFLVFYFVIFSRLVAKHTQRIRADPRPRLPFWNFFDRSSFIVMAIMMAGGMWLRLAHIFPNWMIAFFYSGLGVALFLCGVRFVGVFIGKGVLTPETGDEPMLGA